MYTCKHIYAYIYICTFGYIGIQLVSRQGSQLLASWVAAQVFQSNYNNSETPLLGNIHNIVIHVQFLSSSPVDCGFGASGGGTVCPLVLEHMSCGPATTNTVMTPYTFLDTTSIYRTSRSSLVGEPRQPHKAYLERLGLFGLIRAYWEDLAPLP